MAETKEPDPFPGRRDINGHPGFRWFVADVWDGREKVAAAALHEDGFPVYLPSLIVTTHYAKVSRHVRLPLFPGYLFVAFHPGALPDCRQWARHGMAGLLMRAGQASDPAMVETGLIDAIREAEDGGLLTDIREPAARCSRGDTQDTLDDRNLKAGAPVRMTGDGPWAGIAAQLVEARPDMRVALLLDMMGQRTPVVAPLDHIEAR